MVVAVESTLTKLKTSLANMGYCVVEYETYQLPVDAIVYESIYLKPCSDFNFINSNEFQNGILMICAKNKTADDIDYILRNRTYSPLF